jgi:hypothetical protein
MAAKTQTKPALSAGFLAEAAVDGVVEMAPETLDDREAGGP